MKLRKIISVIITGVLIFTAPFAPKADSPISLQEVIFENASGRIYTSADDSVKARMHVTSTEAIDAAFITAAYNGNVLTGVNYTPVSLTEGDNTVEGASVPTIAGGRASAYLWSRDINPLVGVSSLTDISRDSSIHSFTIVARDVYKAADVYKSASVIDETITLSATVTQTEKAYVYGKTIIINYPRYASVTALQPIIEVAEGATVSPASGVVRDFSSPVTYTVTAADGSQSVYTTMLREDMIGWQEDFTGATVDSETGIPQDSPSVFYAQGLAHLGNLSGAWEKCQDGIGTYSISNNALTFSKEEKGASFWIYKRIQSSTKFPLVYSSVQFDIKFDVAEDSQNTGILEIGVGPCTHSDYNKTNPIKLYFNKRDSSTITMSFRTENNSFSPFVAVLSIGESHTIRYETMLKFSQETPNNNAATKTGALTRFFVDGKYVGETSDERAGFPVKFEASKDVWKFMPLSSFVGSVTVDNFEFCTGMTTNADNR